MANPHVSDYTKVSEQIVLDLINHSNNTSFNTEHMELGSLAAVPESRAVEVTVTAKRGSGYYGSQQMTYNRVLLSEIPSATDGAEHEFDLSKVSGLLEFVNTKYGVNIQKNDVVIDGNDLNDIDPAIVQEYDVPQTFTVAAKPSSFVWMGEITLTITRTRVNLMDLWQIDVLDGLEPPFPWPKTDAVAQRSDGSVATRLDGSIHIFAA